MGVLEGLPGGNLGLGLSGWYVLAAGHICRASGGGTMLLVGQRQHS
jgi:hypothetical protein